MLKHFTPTFIKKIDTWLIKNYPAVWVTRIHYVLFCFLCLSLFCFLIGSLIPVDLKDNNTSVLWYSLLLIACFILSWYWGFKYIVFNIEKRFGLTSITQVYFNALLTLTCVYLLTIIPNFYVYAHNQKFKNAVSDKQLFIDIALMNSLEPYVPTNLYNYENTFDTLLKLNKSNIRHYKNFNDYTPYTLNNYDYKNYSDNGEISFSNVKPIYDKKYLIKLINQHIAVCEKYKVSATIDASAVADTFIVNYKAGWRINNNNYSNDYYKNNIKDVFRNIYNAKLDYPFYLQPDYLYVQLYIVLTLTLLIWLFKLTYWRQYLLTAVIFFLYPIIMLIIFSIISNSTSKMMYYSFFVYFIASLVFTLLSLKNKQEFKPLQMVGTIGTLILMLYLPLIILMYLKDCTPLFKYEYPANYDSLGKQIVVNSNYKYVYDWTYYYATIMNDWWYEHYKKWLTWLKALSPILVFALLPAFHTILRKQLALPKKVN